MKLGNWTDSECFYVSVIDGNRSAFVAGPFRAHESALAALPTARTLGIDVDPKAVFYAWGTAKRSNGYREGSLNAQLAKTHPELHCGEWHATPDLFRELTALMQGTEQTPLRLGNVEFWIDQGGPWAGQLSFSVPVRAMGRRRHGANREGTGGRKP